MTLAVSKAFQALLDEQSGVLSRRQATQTGMTSSSVDSKLRSGRWQQLEQGVYATFTGVPGRQAKLWAVVLRAGPGAVLSHWTAAELSGLLDEPRGLIHVTVPETRCPKAIDGTVIHRSASAAVTRHPVLLPPRTRIEHTVLDLTQLSGSFDQAFTWVSRAVGRRLTTTARLQAALETRRRARWRAELLVALTDVAEGIMSPLERRYVYGVERAHGLPQARRQVKIVTGGRVHYLDNFYEEAKLAVELDGRAAHPDEQRWADSHRDNAHAGIGIMTIRYNWRDCTELACASAAEVAGMLDMRGMRVSPRRCGRDCTARW